MTFLNQASKLKAFYWLFFALSFLFPAILGTNYTLNHFYVEGVTDGGDIIDSGWYIYMSTHAAQWPLPNPNVIGGTFFSTHMSFIFYLYTGFYRALTYFCNFVPAPFFFALTQGFACGLLSLSSYSLMQPNDKKITLNSLVISFLFSLLVMLNGVSLYAIVHPHFEMLIPSAILSFFALWINGYKKICYAPLILGLLVKEDVGLHDFSILILLAFFLYYITKQPGLKHYSKFFLVLAIGCGSYSIGMIIFQNLFFHPTIMSTVYLGFPPYQHVNFEFIKHRLFFNLTHCSYIYIPLFICCILALFRKEKILFLGPVSVLPWIIFSFFAIGLPSGSSAAGNLSFYYGFPIITAFLWPAIAYGLLKFTHALTRSYASYCFDAIITVGASTIMFCIFSNVLPHLPHRDYTYPLHFFDFKWSKYWKDSQKTLDKLLDHPQENILLDRSVATLEFDKITPENTFSAGLKLSENQMNTINTLIFQVDNRTYSQVEAVRNKLKLNQVIRLPGTPYVLAKRDE